MKIGVVGSGLAAIGTIKQLIKLGYHPVVLDLGKELPKKNLDDARKVKETPQSKWGQGKQYEIFENESIKSKEPFPKKLTFGSDFFYGKSEKFSKIDSEGPLPPFSYAKGGLSMGWGASILPPDPNEIKHWPIKYESLDPFFEESIRGEYISADHDNLEKYFKLYGNKVSPLKLSQGNKNILKSLNQKIGNTHKDICFGQARMMTNAQSCSYCGQCMSGCVYGHIYKVSTELDKLIAVNKITYIKNTLVISYKEEADSVKLFCKDISKDSDVEYVFDKVFIGAGATNSTRIFLKSGNHINKKVRLLSTSGFVVPVFSPFPSKFEWPNLNTQPGIFLEYKFENRWIHTQLSTPNELVYQMLGIGLKGNGITTKIKKYLSRHLLIAHCNIHSDNSNAYQLWLDAEGNFHSSREDGSPYMSRIKKAASTLFKILLKTNKLALTPMLKHTLNSGSYHVGGTLPCSSSPSEFNHTDLLGRPIDHQNVHFIDSSVLPEVPGTTIGFLVMANSARIASGALKAN